MGLNDGTPTEAAKIEQAPGGTSGRLQSREALERMGL